MKFEIVSLDFTYEWIGNPAKTYKENRHEIN
jgi:hypothetical protein